MKVFEISHTPRPPNARFRSFAGLSLKEKDTQVFTKIGKGLPFDSEWKPLVLFIPNPRLPRPDIYGFPGGFVMAEEALTILSEPLETSAEVLPVSIEGDAKRFFLCHILTCMNAVDRERSEWLSVGGKRDPKMLTRPAFIADRLGEECLFKIPDDQYVGNYCIERTNDPSEGEFKALVEHNVLTGLEFNEVWSA